jgi:SAM-dependent methyltransferase
VGLDLDSVAGWYSSHDGLHARVLDYDWQAIATHVRGRSCLELGSADGGLTGHLLAHFETVVAVDGSQEACRALRERHAGAENLSVVSALFEELELAERFDTIVSDHVVEHLPDPVAALRQAKRWVADGGVLVAVVPNALSLHRIVGVAMGMLAAEDELNERDRALGHFRVYDPDSLRADLEAAGWSVIAEGGTFAKPFSNAQLEAMLEAGVIGTEQLDGLAGLAARLPRHASDIYVVAEPCSRS